jgi:hypothetical protein
MADRECLIIDDVHAALDVMTDVGRNAASEASFAVRDAVLSHAARRNWAVVPYGAFAVWAANVLGRDEHSWVVLDPLFPSHQFGERVRPLRLTRAASGFGFDQDEGWHIGDASDSIGVLDDAAASGRTLRHVSAALEQAGKKVSRFVLCASTSMARAAAKRSAPDALWVDFVAGDWRILHLRDGCPHLPFSGFRTDQKVLLDSAGASVDLRTPAPEVPGSLWQVLCVDPVIRKLVAAARLSVAERLSLLLGRPATIRDLYGMGRGVFGFVRPGQSATAETTLHSLLLSS